MGCGDLSWLGLSRLHREAAVELIFREEQQALARAVVFYRDVPGPHRGPGPAHLMDAVPCGTCDAQRQGIRMPLSQLFYRYLPPCCPVADVKWACYTIRRASCRRKIAIAALPRLDASRFLDYHRNVMLNVLVLTNMNRGVKWLVGVIA